MGNISQVTRGVFVGGIPNRKARVICSDVCPWQIGLGMHNFRAALRSGDSKSRKKSLNERSRIRGASPGRKSYRSKRRQVIRHKNRRVFLSRWEKSTRRLSVNKAIDADSSYNEACKTLRRLPFRKNGQLRRYMAKRGMFLSKDKVLSQKGPIYSTKDITMFDRSISVSMVKFKHVRDKRRSEWIFNTSYLRLPHQYVKHAGSNGFVKYCNLIRCVGYHGAFHMTCSWKSKFASRIKKIMLEHEKKVGVTFWNKSEKSRPMRVDYLNFKKWRDALTTWQTHKFLCRSCYREKYKTEFDEDKGHWKTDFKYDIMYSIDRISKLPNKCDKCLNVEL